MSNNFIFSWQFRQQPSSDIRVIVSNTFLWLLKWKSNRIIVLYKPFYNKLETNIVLVLVLFWAMPWTIKDIYMNGKKIYFLCGNIGHQKTFRDHCNFRLCANFCSITNILSAIFLSAVFPTLNIWSILSSNRYNNI